MTIDEFLKDDQPIGNLWLDQPEFDGLYVRKGRKIYFHLGELRDRMYDVSKCIQLANVEAKVKGEALLRGLSLI